ncbi:S-adenosyl-L-methionine-dependent methyltransferase [Coprinopsis sp. MPI-PUGE-AT-0042]|nr:S-adenosyl-L-methionine-dependent methyltransferase [Coprinopsis sp. MPI-PUGE-AT-0042]
MSYRWHPYYASDTSSSGDHRGSDDTESSGSLPDLYFGSDLQSDPSSGASFPSFSSSSSVSSSVTSYTHDPSDSEGSPPTAVIELTDEQHAAMYKEEYGRSLNAYSDVYQLPVDEEEFGRLRKQHDMLAHIIGKYPPPLPRILTSNIPGEKAVLDLGCGNGDWICSVATDFPNCEAVGVDLVPCPTEAPDNVRFEVDDINLGIEHFYGQFDVVHCRLISPGISDYLLLIDQIARVLRPGGLMILGESDCIIYDVDHRPIPAPLDAAGPPWWPRWMTHLRAAIEQRGGSIEAARHLLRWVRDHGGFTNMSYQDVWLPAVAGPDDDYEDPIYSHMKDDVLTFIRSGRPLLLKGGFSEETVVALEDNAVRELHESESPMFSRFTRMWAIRVDDGTL